MHREVRQILIGGSTLGNGRGRVAELDAGVASAHAQRPEGRA